MVLILFGVWTLLFRTADSFEARMKVMEIYLKDPEFHAYFEKAAKCIYRVQNYVCVPNPEIGITHGSPKSEFFLRYCVLTR